MKNTVLITGANSFIAKHIIPILSEKYQLKFLTRNPKLENEFQWDVENKTIDEKALDNVDYIIHLAGAKLNDGTPLTDERKRLIYDSRIGAANLLREKLIARNQKIKGFVSASAIGYYGYHDDQLEIDENGKRGIGFAADLSNDWEKAADKFKTDNVAINVAKIRVSIVLGKEGGIFPVYVSILKQNPSIVFDGNLQSVPWNHVKDMAGIFAYAVEHDLDGVYNSVAPNPASQLNIYQAISNELELNDNQKLKPFQGKHLVANKIQDAGFRFKFPDIESAVKDILSNS